FSVKTKFKLSTCVLTKEMGAGILDYTEDEILLVAEVPKICRMEADGGPCRSYFKRYAFNLSSMRCEEFVYGGCYGNDNNFKDLQSYCYNVCRKGLAMGFSTNP
uniref:Tissue factor pathway inhibitor 2 n=1 Tax=Nothoprocta perdicaria TaxID=30464 RepID=A0A8C6YK89_NOTPE